LGEPLLLVAVQAMGSRPSIGIVVIGR
jgi:hypothetical protein